MKYRSLLLLGLMSCLTGCAFSKPTAAENQLFGQNEFGLTVDWLMAGQDQPDVTLKATRLLSPSGETYGADAPVTLPAAVPQTLILKAEFPKDQINQDIDFLRGAIRFDERTVYVPAQLVAEELNGNKRRLTFQVTGLNAAFRVEKSAKGKLQIEVFSRSMRLGILELNVRTPPSEITIEEIPIKAWESTHAQGDTSEYLKPILSGKQLNLVRAIRYSNAEIIPIQIQTPRRPKGTLTQATNQISYLQGECGYSPVNNPVEDVLGSDVILLPLDDRFITEAERLVQAPEVVGSLSSTIQPGTDAFFGVYALGDGADQWMNSGPLGPELKTVAVISACGQRCVSHTCEPTPGHDRLMGMAESLRGCGCERYERTYVHTDISIGVDRHGVTLRLPKDSTQTPVRFADLDPHRDGEVRIFPSLSEESEVTWLR